jgi:hypothetical protein
MDGETVLLHKHNSIFVKEMSNGKSGWRMMQTRRRGRRPLSKAERRSNGEASEKRRGRAELLELENDVAELGIAFNLECDCAAGFYGVESGAEFFEICYGFCIYAVDDVAGC